MRGPPRYVEARLVLFFLFGACAGNTVGTYYGTYYGVRVAALEKLCDERAAP